MEKKLMLPANYNVMNEEEMTYTSGGDGFYRSVCCGLDDRRSHFCCKPDLGSGSDPYLDQEQQEERREYHRSGSKGHQCRCRLHG